jgi:pyruvate dehydrogenase E1 component alpha subunit
MRMHGHAAHDDMRYVPPELLEQWRARDPIERQERRVAELGVDLRSLREQVADEVERAAEEALAMEMPDPAGAGRGVFCDGEPELLGDGVAPWSAFRGAGDV